MSRTRSWTSYTPGRISAKPAGSRPHSSAGQDTTAFSPLTPCGLPWYIHWSTPLSSTTTIGASALYLAGTWRRNMSGGSTTWSSMLTRIRSSASIRLSSPIQRRSRIRLAVALGSRRQQARDRRGIQQQRIGHGQLAGVGDHVVQDGLQVVALDLVDGD